MLHGFYVVQYESNAIKVEAISYMCSNTVMMNDVIRSVFITGSIASFLNDNRDTCDSEVLVSRLLNHMDLSIFNNNEYTHIHCLLINLIEDYLSL